VAAGIQAVMVDPVVEEIQEVLLDKPVLLIEAAAQEVDQAK
jgi:hypothetical protein